jgi:flagellar hook-basal body complex protein FliE
MESIKNASINSQIPFYDQKKGTGAHQKSFADTFKSLISQVDSQIKDADRKTEEFALGKNYDLHEIMIASEKADISLNLLLRIRGKLVEAYQEIMRMSF